MVKTNKFKSAVREIVSRTRTYIPEIGDYVKHYATNDFQFIVHLSNGKLKMPEEAAHSYEMMPSHVPENWIEEIANTIEYNASKTKGLDVPNSGWQKFLALIGIRS